MVLVYNIKKYILPNTLVIDPHPFYHHKISKNRFSGLLFLYILWPFGAFLYALRSYYARESQIIIILFTAFLGYNMMAESVGPDLYGVLQLAQIYSDISLKEILKMIGGLYSSDEAASVDIYKDSIAFLVSRVTTNGKVLLLIFALFYSIFYINSISIFLRVYSDWYDLHFIIILICFSFIFGIDQIAGVRFATAAYVFFIGAVKFIETENKRYLLIIIGAPLIHFSYIPLVLILGLYLVIRKFNFIIYFILVLSFVAPLLAGGYIDQVSSFFGSRVQERFDMYTYPGLMQGAQLSNLAWYVNFREELMLYYSFIILIYTRIKTKELVLNNLINSIYFLSLLLLSYVNFTNHIPHVGYRFQFNFIMFVMFYLFLVFKENVQNRKIRVLISLALPAFLLQIFYSLRGILYFTSPMTYVGNVITIFFGEFEESTWTILFK